MSELGNPIPYAIVPIQYLMTYLSSITWSGGGNLLYLARMLMIIARPSIVH